MSDQLEFIWAEQFCAESATAPKPFRSEPPCPDSCDKPPVPRTVQPETGIFPEPSQPPQEEEMQQEADSLLRELCGRTGMTLRLRITNNTSTLMAVRHMVAGKSAKVSLHHMFLRAPEPVRHALAHWIRHPRSKTCAPVLNGFLREQRHLIEPRKPRAMNAITTGRHHDLLPVFDEMNDRYFNNAITAGITWGKMPTLRRCRSIRFGSYDARANVIRIHPLLDQAFVPSFFVEYIVYHEMLHAHLGIKEFPSGRRSIHGVAFQQQERQYPDYARALEWMKTPENLNRLLRRGRGFAPLRKR